MRSKIFTSKMWTRTIACVFLLFSSLSVLAFTFMFVNSIISYPEFDLEYNDLIYEELTVERYEKIRIRTGNVGHGYKYIVYFEEYDKPFNISKIADKRLNKTHFECLTNGKKLKVYYKEISSTKYDYELCEIIHGSTVLLSLDDYVKTNQDNQMAGMFVYPILAIFGIVATCCMYYLAFAPEKPYKSKEQIGKKKIEYTVDSNTICVHSSIRVCHLVINDKVVDQRWGVFATNFLLQGKINIDGKKVAVEARKGYVNIRLYYDGNLVATKFVGLG